MLDILEYKVIPLYFERDHQGYSPNWVKYAKNSMKSIIPHFNAQRMVMDYVRQFYGPARDQHKRLKENQAAPAVELSRWKKKVKKSWSGVSMQLVDKVPTEIKYHEALPITVSAVLNGLSQDDVVVECLLGYEEDDGRFKLHGRYSLEPESRAGSELSYFSLQLHPDNSGLQYYRIRMYPCHPLLSHPFEMGCMIWL